MSEFPPLSREAFRASLRCVFRELTERVIIVRELLCAQQTHHRRLAFFFHSNSLQVFQDPLRCSNSADGIVARLLQACSFWLFVTSATRRRGSHVAERCVQGIGTSLTTAKSQGWKNEQAGVVAAYDLCGSASWEDPVRRHDSRCALCTVARRFIGVNWRI